MARTRGAKSSSPSNRKRVCERSQSSSAPEPSPSSQILLGEARATKAAGKTIPYQVRRSAIAEETQGESSEPIDLTEQSPEPSPIPSPVQTPVPSPVPSPSPLPVPSGTISGTARKISGASSATSEPQIQLKQLWKNIQSEARACPIIPAAEENPTLIHFTIDGRHGILGARHIAEALQIPFEPTQFDNFRAWANPTELEMHWTQRRGVSWKLLQDVRGFFFGPHHLIMAALLYFEEKVHKKKLQRADCIPLLFPRLLCQILEHLGYPSEPQLERKRIFPSTSCKESIPRHIPEGITVVAPAIPRAPPAAPASSQPSTSAEPRMAIPISEYRELCRAWETLTASQSNLAQEMAAIRACQEQMLATQAQQAAILRQLQVHFDLPQAVEPSTDTPTEPHPHPSESHPS
ncbi:hypothetical protein CK203_113178 [Vitis vinifera]|uniref:Uncharacterized protein n=1 Tax=Vitis vinifera TaxID=29760 RepID=A0A438FFE6_VITVI|nr:hypothetical protein CK203_113178 [Vitis vinifera]